jgi:O-Antigen ligase
VAAFVLVPTAVLALALNGGGYDIVVRQEAALACWWLLGLGFLFGYLPRAGVTREARLPLFAVAALAAWMAVSLAWTDSDERALEEIARTLGYLGGGTLLFATLGPRTWRSAAAGLTVAAAGVCGVALLSRVAPGLLHSSAAFVDAFGTKRLAYPLGYWNAVGIVGAMTLVMGIAWSAHARSARWRALALAVTPLAGAAVYLSYSRTAVIAAWLGTALVVVLSRNRRLAVEHAVAAALGSAAAVIVVHSEPQIAQGAGSAGAWIVVATLAVAAAGCGQVGWFAMPGGPGRRRSRPARALLVANAAAVAGLLVALALVPRPGVVTRQETSGPVAGTAASPVRRDVAARLVSTGGPRGDLWSAGLRAFRDNPVKGLGAGSYEFYWDRTTQNGNPLRDAHSFVITEMAELGLLGLLLVVALGLGLVRICTRARRQARSPADAGATTALIAGFAVFALSGLVDWSYEIPAVAALGLGCVAIAGCSLSGPRPASRRVGRSVALGAAAILIGLLQIPAVVGTQLVRASSQRVEDGDLSQAAALAAHAVDAEPWAATPRLQQAFVALRAGDVEAAARFAQDAADRDPADYYTRFLLAQYQLQAAEQADAIASLRATAELRPALTGQIRATIRAVRNEGSGNG